MVAPGGCASTDANNSSLFRGQNGHVNDRDSLNLGNTCSKLDFLQINLHHCVAAMENLNSLLRGYKTEKIALIQEPYIARGKISGICKDFKTISEAKTLKLFQGLPKILGPAL